MRIARVFFDVDLRCGFEGLQKVLKDHDIEAATIRPDDVIVFMNRATTAFKVLTASKYLVYFKNGSRRVPLNAFQFLPEAFGGNGFDFNRSIKRSILQKLNIES